MCFSLFLPHPPRHCHSFAYAHLPCRGSLSISPSSEKPVLAVSIPPVCSFFLAEWQYVLHVLLFEHAQLLVLFSSGGPGASGDLLGRSEPTSLQLTLWAGDDILSSAPSAVLCWTQLIFQVLLMWKLWRNGTDGCITLSVLPSDFQQTVFEELSWERSGLFPGISQTLENKLFSSLPVISAKKCWKSKWKIKAHEDRNSFGYLC